MKRAHNLYLFFILSVWPSLLSFWKSIYLPNCVIFFLFRCCCRYWNETNEFSKNIEILIPPSRTSFLLLFIYLCMCIYTHKSKRNGIDVEEKKWWCFGHQANRMKTTETAKAFFFPFPAIVMLMFQFLLQLFTHAHSFPTLILSFGIRQRYVRTAIRMNNFAEMFLITLYTCIHKRV